MAPAPQISGWFWTMLESSDRSLKALCRQLEQSTPDQLRQYCEEYSEAKDCVDPCAWVECHPHLSKECSEDHGDDFAAWVVMQGRAFFEQVLSHPEAIAKYMDRFERSERDQTDSSRWDESVDRVEYVGSQRADYIASCILRERYHQS